MILFTLFYQLLYQASIMIRFQHLPYEKVNKKLRRNKRLVSLSCAFMVLIYASSVIKNLFYHSDDVEISQYFKNLNLLKTLVYVSTYILLSWLTIKIIQLSFGYIDVL